MPRYVTRSSWLREHNNGGRVDRYRRRRVCTSIVIDGLAWKKNNNKKSEKKRSFPSGGMEFVVIDAAVVRSNCCPATAVRGADCPSAGFEDVERLDLSCSNILHIANLSLLSPINLTSLKLSVNRIDRICNLEAFTNLIELDLSHNRIKRIENLQGLVNLRRLILNHNPLTNVQNLDTQRDSLEMLDIGRCEIADLKFTLYLKRFTNLVSLTVEGNPFRIEPVESERTFIVSVVRSLLVYNNKTVTAEEKNKAVETYSKLIEYLKKNDEKRKHLSEVDKLRLQRMDSRKNAFLDRIPENEDVDFNVSIFRNPTVEQVLKENGRYGIHNVYRFYAEEFRRLVSEITTAAETSRDSRARVIDEFRDKLQRLTDDGVDESRKRVSQFDAYRERLERDLSDVGTESVDVEPRPVSVPAAEVRWPLSSSSGRTAEAARERFDGRTRAVWLALMSHEDRLSRKTSDMIDGLRDVLGKQIAEFKLLVGERFGALRKQQNVFLQFVLEYAVSSAQVVDRNNRFGRMSRFTNDISQCMELQALQMERAESYIINSASKWLDDVFDELNGEEAQRKRRKVSEIATFIRFQNELFMQKLI